MLAGQTQDGKREGRKQRKENKYKPEAKYRKRKNPIHLSLNLVVNDHQLGLRGRKEKKDSPGFTPPVASLRVNLLLLLENGDKHFGKVQKEFMSLAGPTLCGLWH